MKFKKKISLYLAIILLFNVIAPFATPAIVRAAAPDITVNLAQGMQTGVVSWVPEILGSSPPGDQIYANFPVGIGDTYEMRLRTHQGWDIIVLVQRAFDTINVTYDIDFRQGQGGTPQPAANNFHVYHAPAELNWVPIDDYLNPAFARPTTTTGPALTGIVWGEPGNNTPPSFLIPTNGGFSIRYYVFEEIHFLFDGENFHFASSGFLPGYVYNISLTQLFPNPGFDPDDPDNDEDQWIRDDDNASYNRFNLGFDPVTVRPFANAGDQVGPYLGDRFNERNTPNIIHHSRYPHAMATPPDVENFVLPGGVIPNEFPRWPANPEEPLGFILEFGVPTMAGDGVDAVPDYTEIVSNASLLISGDRHSITLILSDVFDPGFNESNVFPLDGSGFTVRNAEVFYNAAGAPFIRLELEIDDGDSWLPSLYYNNMSTITLLPVDDPTRGTVGSLATPNRGTILPPVYTLLHYGIIIVDGQYFVDIKTNYQTAGVYVVIEGADPSFVIGDPLQVPFISISAPVTAGQAPNPVPVRGNVLAATGRYFQVFFLPGGPLLPGEEEMILSGTMPARALTSQVLWFRGSEFDLTLRTPQLFSVVLESHTPQQGNVLREEGIAELRVNWDIGTYDLIHNLHERLQDDDGYFVIYYDLNWTLTPTEADDLPDTSELFARVRVRFTSDAGISAVDYALLDANNNPVTPDANGVSTIGGLQMRAPRNEPPIPNPVLGSYMAEVFFTVETFHQLHSGEPAATVPIVPPRGIRFPAVYFMNVRAVVVAGNDDLQIPASEYDSFSISDFDTPQVPPPQNLVISNPVVTTAALGDPEDRVSFDLSWEIPGAQIRRYLEQSFGLLPYDANAPSPFDFGPFDFEMTIYISQNENFMRDEFALIRDTVGERHHDFRRAAPTIVADASVADPPIVAASLNAPDANNRILTSNINEDSFNLSIDARNALRTGNTVAITGLRLTPAQWSAVTTGGALYAVSYTIDGLDKNQSYFVYVDFVIRQSLGLEDDLNGNNGNNNNNNGNNGNNGNNNGNGFNIGDFRIIEEASFLSNLDGILMPDDPEIPDGVDREPPAIDLNVEEGSITRSSVILYWNRIPPMQVPPAYTESVEYEIIRTRDTQMAAEHLDNRVPFAQIWNAISGDHIEVIGARTSGAALQSWTGSAWGGAPNLMEIISDANGNPIRLWDGSLAANTLYFYYVRVVRTVVGPSGTFQTFSVWSNVSVTTTIAQAPRNLRIETGREDFNRLSEIMISFEAPLEYASLSQFLGNTSSGVRMQYQLRPDDGDWLDPVFMRDAFLLQHAQPRPDDEGPWSWFLYHITGLEAGTMYTVRVRMVEFENGQAISYSIWSNEASWSTDTDAEEDEYNRLERDWNDYLRRRLEELLRRHYWILREDGNAFHAIYRIAMFNDLVATAAGGQIRLPFEDADQTSYYLPIAIFAQAWDAELAFVLENAGGNMSIMMPARSIDLHNNDQVIDIGSTINRNIFEDYMVRFNVNWTPQTQIHGEDALTPIADVRFDLISTRLNIGAWQNGVQQALVARVEAILTDPIVLADISNAVRGQVPNEDISRYMVQVVERARQDIIALANSHMNQLRVGTRTLTVPRLDRSIAISAMASPNLSALEAYQSVGNNLWNNIPTVQIGNGQGIFTSQPGFFVFTGREIVIDGIEQVVGGPVATGVVARHGLDEFFGIGNFNVEQIATRGQLINSVARMIGAPRGTDAIAWLRSNGINAAAAGFNNPISNQAALELITLVYEAQTGTAISSLRITNFAVVNNMPNLDPRYRTHVQAAVELGLINGANFQPAAPMSVGELLEVLALLDRLIGL